jgi:alkyldihydroxyacetonephosphate synthase
VDDFDLAPSRLEIPPALLEIVSTTPYDRLAHAFGKSYADMARMYLRQVPNPPDGVAFPRNEQDLSALFEFAEQHNIALIPFGGGTSVCGGVEPDVGTHYRATISVDMQHFDQLLDVDPVGRRAKVQAGMLGPALEAALKPHGLTLRHYPQSFPFVTVGGMVVTRAGGHFATGYTHIEDLVEATRMVTPAGVVETRPLPGSGAGPSGDRLVCGSEGVFGVLTEAWLKLQQRPRFRATASVRFDNMMLAAEAVREISQAGLYPSNCRVLDEMEVALNRVADEPCAILVLGFESAHHAVDHWMTIALEIATKHHGRLGPEGIQSNADHRDKEANAAESWRNAFIRMPYWRNELTAYGIIADTFETAITWDKFPAFYKTIMQELGATIAELTQRQYALSCRFTHVYPDGPAPYFTFYAVGSEHGDLNNALDIWRKIKQRSMELVAEHGGTVTHHHAVGRDHRFGYQQQTSPLLRLGLAGAKAQFDPHGIMNPGALIDPLKTPMGIRGVMADD